MNATICVVLYGPYTPLHKRCLESLVTRTETDDLNLRIGMNCVPTATRQLIAGIHKIDLLVDSEKNIGKYPMMRKLFHGKTLLTEWIVWLDDDSYVVGDGWLPRMLSYAEENKADCIGKKPAAGDDLMVGGFWAARDTTLKQLDWPRREWKQEYKDNTLAVETLAAGLSFVSYGTDLMVNQNDSRGASPRVRTRYC